MDGLDNFTEFQFGTSPIDIDSDADTMPDRWEYDYDSNPAIDDAQGDLDADGPANVRIHRVVGPGLPVSPGG